MYITQITGAFTTVWFAHQISRDSILSLYIVHNSSPRIVRNITNFLGARSLSPVPFLVVDSLILDDNLLFNKTYRDAFTQSYQRLVRD